MELAEGSKGTDPHLLHEQLVPFLGSAVSLFAPTSLPTWSGFTKAVVGALEGQSLTKLRVEERELASRWDNCHRTLDIVIRRLGSRYLDVIQGLLNRPPNQVHMMVVDNICGGKYPAIVTTNFDRAIEDELLLRGVPVCDIVGLSDKKDMAVLDKLFSKPAPMHVIVITNPTAFGLLERVPSLIGRKDTCIILKVHGDASYPQSCVDTETQREIGLPAPVRLVLSVLLRRYPMFFMGWGGGDLDHNSDYTRLESEADKARVYWLLMPGAEEPTVLSRLKNQFQTRGGTFNVVRGAFAGSFSSESNAFDQAASMWAKKKVGSPWASLTILDLQREYSSEDPFPNSHEAHDSSSGNCLFIAKWLRTSNNSFAHKHLEFVGACVRTLDLVKRMCESPKRIQEAWSQSKVAIVLAKNLLPGNDLRFQDSWIPFFLASLVVSGSEQLTLAQDLLSDAQLLATQSGNRKATDFISSSSLALSLLSQATNKSSQPIAESNAQLVPVTTPEEILDPLQVFTLSADNMRQSREGFPEGDLMRAELFRTLLVADTVVMPPQAVLNSRVLITEVLFDENQQPREELIRLIQPMLPAKFQNEVAPLVAHRMQWVKDPNFLHEDIPDSFINSLQKIYSESSAPPVVYYDLAPVSSCYKVRTVAFVSDPASASIAYPDDSRLRAQANKSVFPLIRRFVLAKTHGMKDGLTRSDMYCLGSLFTNQPTSMDDLWKTTLDDEARTIAGPKETFVDERNEALRFPWRTMDIFKDASDAAYVTNLPIFLQLSIALSDPVRDMRLMRLVGIALEKESVGNIPKKPVLDVMVDAMIVSRLKVHQVLSLRNSTQGRAFRSAARRYRDSSSLENEKALSMASSAFTSIVKLSLIEPAKRELPSTLRSKNAIKMDSKIVDQVTDEVMSVLIPSMSPPPMPLYDLPSLGFPGLLVLSRSTS